ncbi:MAG TPA: alpha-glucosidase/alpha-galactosidase, partial [Nitrososphaeria archaeon]|nr:alpha-glucosidase/alpha-galactosidase [Nitrososphaeria archaeon]
MIGKDDAKIVFIGAGSAVWSSRIIIDLIINKDLQNVEVWLNDIDDHRLNLVYGFSTRYAREYGSSIKFRKTKDQVEAIRGADFVINAAMARGHGYYERMRRVSERYGYYRGINSVEWNMVSDYHTIWGYYQFKLALEIAHRVEEYAPNA